MYERKPYLERAHHETGTASYPVTVPVFDTPISIQENFKRVCTNDNPLWLPNSFTDMNYVQGGELTGLSDIRFTFGPDPVDWVDLFGCTWEWEPLAGGSMLKPGGKKVLEDITDWETDIVWPDLDEERIKKCVEEYTSKPYYQPTKLNYYDFGQGCTERLVAILGGYEEGMCALLEEPEACKDFMMELTRFHIKMFDLVNKYLPTDMIMYHDDWGTERDTFFSEAVMEEMVFEPTKIFFDHVKSQGCAISFHSCGNNKRFIPYMVDLNPEFLQLQLRCNDLVAYKEKYGDDIGFDVTFHTANREVMESETHQFLEELGQNGRLIRTVFGNDQEVVWDGCEELYNYSREFYDKKQAK